MLRYRLCLDRRKFAKTVLGYRASNGSVDRFLRRVSSRQLYAGDVAGGDIAVPTDVHLPGRHVENDALVFDLGFDRAPVVGDRNAGK